MVDKLFYILFRWRPDLKLAKMGLIGAPMKTVIEKLRKARSRVTSTYGEGFQGLAMDFSNVNDIGNHAGWLDEMWIADEEAEPEVDNTPQPKMLPGQRPLKALMDGKCSSPMQATTTRPGTVPPKVAGIAKQCPPRHIVDGPQKATRKTAPPPQPLGNTRELMGRSLILKHDHRANRFLLMEDSTRFTLHPPSFLNHIYFDLMLDFDDHHSV